MYNFYIWKKSTVNNHIQVMIMWISGINASCIPQLSRNVDSLAKNDPIVLSPVEMKRCLAKFLKQFQEGQKLILQDITEKLSIINICIIGKSNQRKCGEGDKVYGNFSCKTFFLF